MVAKNDRQEHSDSEFSEIVKKAYNRGLSDTGVTVQKLIEDLKIDLLKLKIN